MNNMGPLTDLCHIQIPENVKVLFCQLAELWNCPLSRKAWAEDEARHTAPGENVQRGLKVRVEVMITHHFQPGDKFALARHFKMLCDAYGGE